MKHLATLFVILVAAAHHGLAREPSITVKAAEVPYHEQSLIEQRISYLEGLLGVMRHDYVVSVMDFQGVAEIVDLGNDNRVVSQAKVLAYNDAKDFATGYVTRERERQVGFSVPAEPKRRGMIMSISFYWKPEGESVPMAYAGKLNRVTGLQTSYAYDEDKYPITVTSPVVQWVDEGYYIVWLYYVMKDQGKGGSVNNAITHYRESLKETGGLVDVEGIERLYMLRLVPMTDEELADLEKSIAEKNGG